MKRLSKQMSIALTAIAVVGTIPVLAGTPVLASLKQAGEVISQALNRPQVNLQLNVEKQVVEDDADQNVANWKTLQGKADVYPGDVLRYTVSGQNVGDTPAKNLAVTQPIPKKMIYVLGSATNNANAKTVYSIDNGKNFVEAPTIQVKLANGQIETRPAPAEAYTHVRWNFTSSLNPKAEVNAAYQVKVR
jgi:uncharacterized repeat protein (TIGR01451 family)